MKRLTIVPYKTLEKASFYTLEDVDKNGIAETDEFIARFINDLIYQRDLFEIATWLNKIGEEYGALERYFRPESSALALPIYKNKLRLYCIRISDELLILGNGGAKTSKKVQDSPDAYPSFRAIIALSKMLAWRRRHGEVTISNRLLHGNLTFEIEL
ncbi:MAG: hypothetical protein WKF87_16355 [Chryseolinea sp.]